MPSEARQALGGRGMLRVTTNKISLTTKSEPSDGEVRGEGESYRADKV